MIDYKPTLVAHLRSLGLPVYLENFLKQDTEMPCISYYELNNQAEQEGDTLGYSNISFNIKIWDKNAKTLATVGSQLDSLMRSLGFKRTAVNELWLDGIGQKQMTYRATAQENF